MVALAVVLGLLYVTATTSLSSRSSIPTKSFGIPIGAVELPLQKIHSFRALLQTVLQEERPLRFRDIFKDNNRTAIVHLPPAAAALLDDHHPLLLDFLQSNSGHYRAGVRRQCPTTDLDLELRDEPAVSIGGVSDSFRFVELFAGIGGFRLGLEAIGGHCVLANELNPDAATIYHQNFDSNNRSSDDKVPNSKTAKLAVGDIMDLDTANIPHHEMLVGGFPCQPFSQRGSQPGFYDDRGQLYQELARILYDKQPECFLFENVPGLVTLGEGGSRTVTSKGNLPEYQAGMVLQQIIDIFAECGYQVSWNVLNTRKWLPQMRERVYIVGTRKDLQCPPFDWNALLLHDLTDESPTRIRGILEPHDSPSVAAATLTDHQYTRLLARKEQNKKGTVMNHLNLLDLDGKAPTLISSYHSVSSVTTKFLLEEADGSIRSTPRFLTPRECTRLMGFPEDFVIPNSADELAVSRYYEVIGNAVCPPVIAAIGKELLKCVANRKIV